MLGEEEGRGGMPSVLDPQPAPHPMVLGRAAPPESHGPSRNLLPRLLPPGEGCLSVARRPGSGPWHLLQPCCTYSPSCHGCFY